MGNGGKSKPMKVTYVLLMLTISLLFGSLSEVFPQHMKVVPAGDFQPFFKGDSAAIRVASFMMDERAVTNKEFLLFVKENPQWAPQNIKRLFADSEYLTHWTAAFVGGGEQQPDKLPVVNVSWFAARAYCQSQGKRLPLIVEWEQAAKSPPVDGTLQAEEIILNWYSRKMPESAAAGSVYRNHYGLYDMFGLVWEWTEDFDRVNFSDDSRNNAEIPAGLFCGSAAMDAADATDYATFIRYAFRASLKGHYTSRKLGFRCAKSL